MVTSDTSSNSPLQRYRQKIQVLRDHHEKSFSHCAQKTSLYEASSLKFMQDLSKRHHSNKNKSKRTKRPQTNTANAPPQKKRVKKASITASASGFESTGTSVSVSDNNAFEGDLFDTFSVDDISGPLPDLEVNDIENVLAMFVDTGGKEMNSNHNKDNAHVTTNQSSEPYFPPPDLFEVPTNVPYTVANGVMPSQTHALKLEDSNFHQFPAENNQQQDNLHYSTSVDSSWQQSSSKLDLFTSNSQQQQNLTHSMPYFTNYNQYNSSMQSQQKSFGHDNKASAYYENQNMNPSINRHLYSTYRAVPNQSFNHPYQSEYSGAIQDHFHQQSQPQLSINQISGQQSMMLSHSASMYSQYPVAPPSHMLARHANYPGNMM